MNNANFQWPKTARLAVGLLLVATAAQHYYALNQPNPFASQTAVTPVAGYLPGSDYFSVGYPANILAEVKALTQADFNSSSHCEASNLQLSWLENALMLVNPFSYLFRQGILVRERFRCGYCHQRAFLLLERLKGRFDHYGVEAQVQGLNGHVILQFVLEGQTFVTDPDYGVGPFEYHNDNEALLQELAPLYAAQENYDQLVSMYLSRDDNRSYASPDALTVIQSKQRQWFHYSNYVAALMLLLGGILVWSGLARSARSRETS